MVQARFQSAKYRALIYEPRHATLPGDTGDAVNNSLDLPFDDVPRSTDVPYREYLDFLRAHPGSTIFIVTVRPGHYRVLWRPGPASEQAGNKSRVDTPPRD